MAKTRHRQRQRKKKRMLKCVISIFETKYFSCGWNKLRQLVPLLANKDMSLIVRLYSSCVQSSMLHGSETWPLKREMRWHFSGQR